MRLSVEQYAEALTELSQKADVRQVLVNFHAFLKRRGEESRLPDILRAIQSKEEGQGNAMTLTVFTRHDASGETKSNIQKKAESLFPGKKITLEYKNDESVIGGFRLQGKENSYDATIANTLKNISQSLKS
jgi:F-type H+-transporting ATPase subunit delta